MNQNLLMNPTSWCIALSVPSFDMIPFAVTKFMSTMMPNFLKSDSVRIFSLGFLISLEWRMTNATSELAEEIKINNDHVRRLQSYIAY